MCGRSRRAGRSLRGFQILWRPLTYYYSATSYISRARGTVSGRRVLRPARRRLGGRRLPPEKARVRGTRPDPGLLPGPPDRRRRHAETTVRARGLPQRQGGSHRGQRRHLRRHTARGPTGCHRRRRRTVRHRLDRAARLRHAQDPQPIPRRDPVRPGREQSDQAADGCRAAGPTATTPSRGRPDGAASSGGRRPGRPTGRRPDRTAELAASAGKGGTARSSPAPPSRSRAPPRLAGPALPASPGRPTPPPGSPQPRRPGRSPAAAAGRRPWG